MTKNKRTCLRKYLTPAHVHLHSILKIDVSTVVQYMMLFPNCAFQNPQYLDLRLLN